MAFFKRNLIVEVGDGAEKLIIKEPLNIQTTVVKAIKTGESDYAQITITNLSEGSRNKLNTQYAKVNIFGGYGDQYDLIFSGDIISSTHKKEGVEWLSSLECGDGVEVLDQAIINKTYEKGFKLGDIIKDFSNISGVALEDLTGIDDTFSLTRGKAFSSDMKEALTELGNANNFDWSIQDGKLVVFKRGKGRASVVNVISARSGMVGSPEWINTGADDQKTATTTGQTFKVNSLCIPSLRPADKIIVKSESLKGRIGSYNYDNEKADYETEFIVTKVQHDLNNRSGNFITQIECITEV